MTPTITVIVTIASSIIGSGAFTACVSWLIRRLDARRDIEASIAESPTIRRLELEIYRQTLFLPTLDRTQHEHQLEVGRQYVSLGGNGCGHVRVAQLEDDYRRRLETDDWTYPQH